MRDSVRSANARYESEIYSKSFCLLYIATPFFITSSSKQINFLIKPDSEHSLIHTKNFNECQNLEASNSYIDAIEI